jgi:formylglycine-generating enzyme required for sulfatase activity
MPSGEIRPQVDSESILINRGGSWDDTADNARAASRYGDYPGNRVISLGFRLCRDLVCEPVRAATGVKQ